MLWILLIYYVIINIIAFFMYGNDKKRAKKDEWRIPESTLIGVAFMGGGIGSYLGMKICRHKTKHWKFKICVPLSIILHVVAIIALIIYIMRALG